MDKKFIEEQKSKLEEQRNSVQKQLETFAKKDNVPKGDWETQYPNRENGNMEEEADEVQEYGNMLPVEHALELKLRDINLALEKIANNPEQYGKCDNCGKDIDRERLLAIPEARTCLKCNN